MKEHDFFYQGRSRQHPSTIVNIPNSDNSNLDLEIIKYLLFSCNKVETMAYSDQPSKRIISIFLRVIRKLKRRLL